MPNNAEPFGGDFGGDFETHRPGGCHRPDQDGPDGPGREGHGPVRGEPDGPGPRRPEPEGRERSTPERGRSDGTGWEGHDPDQGGPGPGHAPETGPPGPDEPHGHEPHGHGPAQGEPHGPGPEPAPGEPRSHDPEPHTSGREPRRIRIERNGPMLVEGPVTVTGDDGVTVTSHRFVVAICTCRRSRSYPWCDTSHRRKGGPR